MNKKRVLLPLALFLGILGLVVWLGRVQQGPVYEGKTVREWMGELEHWDGDTNNAAYVVFEKMGTNAVPVLVETIQTGVPEWKRTIEDLSRRQSLIHLPFGELSDQALGAARALYAMGTNAMPAFPELTNMLFNPKYASGLESGIALAGMGHAGVSILLAAMTNQNDRIRHDATGNIGWARCDFDEIVPALVNNLRDSQSLVRHAAAISIGHLCVRPDLSIPALTNCLADPDNLQRRLVLGALGRFGPDAKASVPMVLTAVNDPQEDVSSSAKNALKQIDPDAAKKAGVE